MPDVCGIPGVGYVCDQIGDAASGTVGAVTAGFGDWIADSMGDMAAGAADMAASAVDATTTVNLEARWFEENYNLLLPIALVTLIGSFSLQLAYAAARQDGTVLRRAVTGTGSGVMFAFCVIPFTMIALGIVDALSAGLFDAAGTSLSEAVERVIRVSLLDANNELGWAMAALMAIGFTIGAFLYWGVMLFRKVGILVLVALAPFAGAGGGWDTARRMRRGWIELTATLVVSKLLMTIIFLIGVSALGQSSPENGSAALADALAGLVVLALVLITPMACYRFVRWAGDGAGGEDIHRGSGAGAAATARGAQTAGRMVVGAKTGGSMAAQGPASWSGAPAGGVVPASRTPSSPGGSGSVGAPNKPGPGEPAATSQPSASPVTPPPPTRSPHAGTSPTADGASGPNPGPGDPPHAAYRPPASPAPPPPQGDDD